MLGSRSGGCCRADVENAEEDTKDSSGSWSSLKAAYAQLAGVTALPAVRAPLSMPGWRCPEMMLGMPLGTTCGGSGCHCAAAEGTLLALFS